MKQLCCCVFLLAGVALAEDLAPYRLDADCDYPSPAPGYALAAPGVAQGDSGGDALYLPLFQPTHQGPWAGNLKKLALRDGQAVDRQGRPALETTGARVGQLRPGAQTQWTGSGLPHGGTPDGGDLRLGGAGQALMVLPVAEQNRLGGRQVFVEPVVHSNGQLASPPPLDASPEAARDLLDALRLEDEGTARSVLRWARGLPLATDDPPRTWRLGAIVNSQPAVVDYGPAFGHPDGPTRRRILFGTRWGFLHMLADEPERPGREVFAYLPRGQLPGLVSLARGEQAQDTAGQGVDGTPVVLRRDRNRDGRIDPADGDRVTVVFGLGRGGRGYQALDISDPDGPPKLLWRIAPELSSDYQHLGLGLSTPVAGRIRFEAGEREVLILGAGYHKGRDARGQPAGEDAGDAPDGLGNAILVVAADTGELLWQATLGEEGRTARQARHPGLRHSIAASPALLRDAAGLVYRAYVGDIAGNVWRVDLPPGDDPSQRARFWGVRRLARLGTAGDHPASRRFFHAPAVFRARDERGTPFDGVILASGNQADPLAVGEQDFLFYLRDYATDPDTQAPPPRVPADLPDLVPCDPRPERCPAISRAGWKLPLAGEGEKGLSVPRLQAGQVWFTSYLPPASVATCVPALGSNRLYRLQLRDGAPAAIQAIHTLAPGLPSDIQPVGRDFWLPAGAPPREQGQGLPRQLVPGGTRARLPLYWRVLGRE